jgi:hypothetical protein
VDSTTLTYLGLALAFIALPFTWLVSRHYATRRNTIAYDSRVIRLVPRRTVDGLSVTWRGASIAEPHLVVLSLVCRGPRDISSDDIRAGHIRCDLGVPVLGVVGSEVDDHGVVFAGTTVSFPDRPLIKGRQLKVSVIVDGEPAPAWDAVVLNGMLYEVGNPPLRMYGLLGAAMFWAVLIFLAYWLMEVFDIQLSESTRELLLVGLIGVFVMLFVALVQLLSILFRDRRVRA